MFYVIVGILILIVSFVVALVSLVWEQRKVEERTNDEEEADGIVATLNSTDENEVVGENVEQPVVDSVRLEGAASVPSVFGHESLSSVQSVDDGDVWWNKISNRSVDDSKLNYTADEEKSIKAIREELARLTGNKIGVGTSHVDKPEVLNAEPSRNEARKRNLLAGEFSLGDIRKKD